MCRQERSAGLKKKHIIRVLKAVLALAIVAYLFRSDRISLQAIRQLFSIHNIPYLCLSALFFIASQFFSGIRLKGLLKTIDFTLNTRSAFAITMVGNFFNTVLPGMIGGDIVKGMYLAKQEPELKGRSAGILIMDRSVGLLALSLTGAAAIVYLLLTSSRVSSMYARQLTAVLWLVFAAIVLFGMVLLAANNKRVRQRIKDVMLSRFSKGLLFHMAEGFGKLAEGKKVLFLSFLLSFLIQLLSLFGLLVLVEVLHAAHPDSIVILAVSSVVMLVGIVPLTPGNIGWVELVASFGWSAVGSNMGGQIFLFWRIVTTLCSLPWGLHYLNPLKRKSGPR